MTIYQHFFWNYTFFYRKSWAWKVGVGGILPDLIYLIGFLPHIFSYHSFREWMMDPLWDVLWSSPLARSAHSAVIWGAIFLPFVILRKKYRFCGQIMPFIIGWGLHVVTDALTHVNDGYPLFFPLSEWRFPTPISYWEQAYHAREFFLISHVLMIGLLVLWLGSKLKKRLLKKKEYVLREEQG